MTFLSTICPCYNLAHYLEAAIKSVQAQTFQDWELIIIDDGSEDHTFEIAQNYAKTDARIKLIHQENKGLSAARNAGIRQATGEFLHFLDADDLIFPTAYQVIYQKSQKELNTVLWISSYSYFDQDDFHTHTFSEKHLHAIDFIQTNQAPPVAHFLKREMIQHIGGFDEQLKSCEDWDLWLRVAKSDAQIKTIPNLLARYRYVSGSMSRNAKIMYFSLSTVTQRAVRTDDRIHSESNVNHDLSWDVSPMIKSYFIKCLGILLHQGKVEEATNWYQKEKAKWEWDFETKDFDGLNSQLTFRYFLDKKQINHLLKETLPNFELFFIKIGFSEQEIKRAIKLVFEPQLKKHNHLKYGRLLGALINRVKY
ncbi:glycosyl transferase [Belliella baltica DSM 15883]|uniref:Glycosyl transferase n=1 Tax=Belliella baltica (strain DSM 15883 / CIP 108006 / LMG 21964 / BA134) TaxID=866536 RepID=I3Z758_BELBD|nr:glycosyltransferase [Belliella baltica]AFL85076.1 glycosyl transferase [Belliella baltica DSM 15883]